MRREQVHMLVDTLLDLGQTLTRNRLPAEAALHFANARRETLLGVRALIDATLDQKPEAPQGTAGPRSIPVEE